jgi:hypothetical protein
MRKSAPKRTPRSAISLSPGTVRGYERYLKVALKLPGTEESTSYGTPAVKVKGKLISRWRTEAEGGLAIRCDFLDRQILLQADPEVFFLTDHYLNYPMILIRLDKISEEGLVDVVERAWRLVAPQALRERHEGTSSPSVIAPRQASGRRRRSQ